MWRGGAAKTSRNHAVDDIVVRSLGVGLILAGLALPLRSVPVYWTGAALLFVGIVEVLIFSPFGTYKTVEIVGTVAILLIMYLLPAAMLVFLALRY